MLEAQIFPSASDRNAEDALLSVPVRARRFLEEHGPGLGSPVGTLAAELAVSHPEVRERIAEIYEGWSHRIEALLEEAAGPATAPRDRRRLARAVVAALEGAMLHARVDGDFEAFDATVDLLRGHLIGANAQREAPRAVAASTALPDRTPPPTADWRTW
jgi:hypothetical protein